MAKEGIFIAIEGGEGSGKSTQIAKLKEYLIAQYPNREFVFTREPGGAPFADEIRALMISPQAAHASGRTMMALIMASRSDHVEQRIVPAQAAGKNVVSDRFLASTYAYQIVGQESPALEKVFWAYAENFPLPDHYLYLDVDPAVGRARVENRHSGSHFHDRPVAFYERVGAGYREYFKKAGIEPAVVDANRGIEEVWKDVQKAVELVLN